MCPAPPVDTPAGRDCLAARTARFRPWLPPQASPAVYLGPTPRLQHFKHVGDQTHAPATRPAAEVLPALTISFVFWVTWLPGPMTAGRMSGPPPRHSFGKAAYSPALPFQGAEYRSSSLTPRPGSFAVTTGRYWPARDIFGVVSQRTHRQALAGLSWLSFSRLRVSRSTRASLARFPLSPEGSSPRRPALNEPRKPRPEPRGRICGLPGRTAHQLCKMAALAHTPKDVRVAHVPVWTHRIERWDYSAGIQSQTGLLQRASVEHGQATLMAIRLYRHST